MSDQKTPEFSLICRQKLSRRWTFILLSFFLFSCIAEPVSSNPDSTSPVIDTPTLPEILLPDLKVQEVERIDASNDPCQTVKEPFQFNITLRNLGNSDSGPFKIQVNEQTIQVSEGIGTDRSAKFEYQGSNTLEINLDIENLVLESDEENNNSIHELPLPTLPALCIESPVPDVRDINPIASLDDHDAEVLSVDISPDGNLLVSGSVDNTMRLWKLGQGELLRTMQGHPFPVLDAKFKPDGLQIASASTDGLGRIWRVSDGALEDTLIGHGNWINSLDYSPDGSMIISGGDDFTVRIWEPDSENNITIDEGMSDVKCVSFSPDGESFGWAENNGFVRIRSLDGDWIHQWKETDQPAKSIAFSDHNSWVAAGFMDGSIRVWDRNDGSLIGLIKAHNGSVNSLAFSPFNNTLVSASSDKTVFIWEYLPAESDFVRKYNLLSHSDAVNDLRFSGDGKILVTASDDGTIKIWMIPEE